MADNRKPPQQSYPPQQMHPPPQQGDSTQPGTSSQQSPVTTMVIRDPQIPAKDYLVFAIFVTMCCCWPLGIVAIIKALNVRKLNGRGDYSLAQQASQKAKKWSIGSLICGIVLQLFFIVFVVVFVVLIVLAINAANNNSNTASSNSNYGLDRLFDGLF
ncbi:Proline-rich transmembrane protein 1 [Holothuria leucospilota]|uniref:Proline-rich transmembrane protein 1 n=1 Tax=Holothuria leucospilota TaxID=206669 RepID=A0A9Q1BNS4_HOLLE|nr:Proline-rich transmembrane protein 1 [Holothuria leucospilota]